MSEQAELLELERRRCAAISGGDVEALKALLSDDYVHVHMNAAVDDRAGHLEGIARRPRQTTRGQLQVRIYADFAVLTGELTNHIASPNEPPRAVRGYCHQVAVRQGGVWRFVSTQLAPMPAV
ncbi:MAG TPA: nuclear transport factor 2 family protein [Polyangiales bacterium]|nr:nuclear transport factor 2 family protein [Polyangiales bacterium]